jgi:hypothetical protein
MKRLPRVLVAALLTVGLFHGAAAAQQRFTVFGMVQWTGANRVQMMTDGGASVNIDVSRVDQAAYAGLRGGDRIRVVGYMSPDRTRVIAESLEVGDASSGYWTFPQTS